MKAWHLGPVVLDWTEPVLMAVLNATPDSFSDGGALRSVKDFRLRAERQIDAGAKILDIGGESTRPGAQPVDEDTELSRVLPVVEALRDLPAAISIDTMKPRVAHAAVSAGAHLVNDVSGLSDPNMAATISNLRCHVCLVHMRGKPRTMQDGEIIYTNVVHEVSDALRSATKKATDAGIKPENIMIDPGIGFGKTVEHNIKLSRALGSFAQIGFPVLYGPSRKRFLGELTGRETHDRDRATAAAVALGIHFGAQVFRVHDVEAVIDAARVAAAFRPE